MDIDLEKMERELERPAGEMDLANWAMRYGPALIAEVRRLEKIVAAYREQFIASQPPVTEGDRRRVVELGLVPKPEKGD